MTFDFESVYPRIKSKDYWVFVSSHETMDIINKIEESYYNAAKDFESVDIGEPNPAGITVSYAKKNRMNRDQLNQLIDSFGERYSMARNSNADVLLMMDSGINRPINEIMRGFYNQLIQYVAERGLD